MGSRKWCSCSWSRGLTFQSRAVCQSCITPASHRDMAWSSLKFHRMRFYFPCASSPILSHFWKIQQGLSRDTSLFWERAFTGGKHSWSREHESRIGSALNCFFIFFTPWSILPGKPREVYHGNRDIFVQFFLFLFTFDNQLLSFWFGRMVSYWGNCFVPYQQC